MFSPDPSVGIASALNWSRVLRMRARCLPSGRPDSKPAQGSSMWLSRAGGPGEGEWDLTAFLLPVPPQVLLDRRA